MLITLKVSDMSCNHCKMAIINEIKEYDQTANINIDLSTKIVEIESNILTQEKATQLIKNLGYTPESV